MRTEQHALLTTTAELNRDFLARFPYKSARYLESIDAKDAASLLSRQNIELVVQLWKFIPISSSDSIFAYFAQNYAATLLQALDSHIAVATLSRMPEKRQHSLLNLVAQQDAPLVHTLQELLNYPADTAARLMTTRLSVFYGDMLAGEALTKLRQSSELSEDIVYIIDHEQQLSGELSLAALIMADSDKQLKTISSPLKSILNALDDKETVTERFETLRCSAMPVLDSHGQLIGMIRFFDIYESTKEDLASDIQTMVGVSKEEKALSGSWFAVKKRLPWLQINLLTAFSAAAVVGAFEGLIAEITALAILLPVAAGQSGNAGAQALAVTMRGLTLREITTRHWRSVMVKELGVGLLNGFATALTCSLAVYWWSQSLGLALVMALAMVSSLAIACTAGAIVPIALKKFGLDPAQSSSIVLTTITDIAGFMSFLGIALLLSDMLPRT